MEANNEFLRQCVRTNEPVQEELEQQQQQQEHLGTAICVDMLWGIPVGEGGVSMLPFPDE